jgi:Tol biopolymer transport system component
MKHTRGGAAVALTLVLAALTSPSAQARPTSHADARGVLAWSRFDDFEDGTARIVRGDPNGGSAQALTHPPTGSQDIDPQIAPDGGAVLFERDTDGQGSTVGIVSVHGYGERRLPLRCDDPCAGVSHPVWTPDGRHVVFSRVVGPFDAVNTSARSAVLWRSDLDGSHLTRLSQRGIDGQYEDYDASFAPAGYIVFLRIRNADIHNALFRMNSDGSHVHQLTPWSLGGDLPSVSSATSGPTRDSVVFETFGQGAPDGIAQAIATVPATCGSLADCTSRIRYLTPRRKLPDQNFNPTWSPDGRRIAYVHYSYTDPGPGVGDIWTMRWDGSRKTAVSTDPRFEFRPAWGRA